MASGSPGAAPRSTCPRRRRAQYAASAGRRSSEPHWDSEESVLRVYETTTFGTPLRATELKVDDPGRFGQLLRERIDASVLVQRHVPLAYKKGVRVVGRRNPSEPDAPVTWNFVLDKGLEPDQPGIVDRAEAALVAVRDEFGI